MEISQIQFEAMKRQIEIDQGKKEHVYQIYQENCVQYFISVARLAGILFPTKIHLSDLLITQPRLKSIRKSFNSSHWIPGIMKSGAHMLWIMTINVANVLLGASMIDHDVGLRCFSGATGLIQTLFQLKNDPRANDIQPYIQKWTDLIDAEKVIAHHPFVIGDFIARQVEEWREAKIQELEFRYGRLSQEDKKSVHFEEVSASSNSKENYFNCTLKEIASIHYALPPWYRLPSIDRVLNDA